MGSNLLADGRSGGQGGRRGFRMNRANASEAVHEFGRRGTGVETVPVAYSKATIEGGGRLDQTESSSAGGR